jgi:hypothetical protein
MQGSRGGVDLPEDEAPRVRGHLARYYDKTGDDPPWESLSRDPTVGTRTGRRRTRNAPVPIPERCTWCLAPPPTPVCPPYAALRIGRAAQDAACAGPGRLRRR